MKLPNGERAIVDCRKLDEYCLNPHHPRGRNKARVFASVGIGQADSTYSGKRCSPLPATRKPNEMVASTPMVQAHRPTDCRPARRMHPLRTFHFPFAGERNRRSRILQPEDLRQRQPRSKGQADTDFSRRWRGAERCVLLRGGAAARRRRTLRRQIRKTTKDPEAALRVRRRREEIPATSCAMESVRKHFSPRSLYDNAASCKFHRRDDCPFARESGSAHILEECAVLSGRKSPCMFHRFVVFASSLLWLSLSNR